MNIWVVKVRQKKSKEGYHWKHYFKKGKKEYYKFFCSSNLSKKYLREEVGKGDIVICYQVDSKEIVGITLMESGGIEWIEGSGDINAFYLVQANKAFNLIDNSITVGEIRKTGCNPDCFGQGKQGTIFPVSNDEFKCIINAIIKKYPDLKDYMEEWLEGVASIGFVREKVYNNMEDKDMLNKIKEYLTHNPNLILYGPPGTGKTYWVRKYVEGKKVELRNTDNDFMNSLLELYKKHENRYGYDEYHERIIKWRDMEDEEFRSFLRELCFKGPIHIPRPSPLRATEYPTEIKGILRELDNTIEKGEDIYILLDKGLKILKDLTGVWQKSFITYLFWMLYPETFFPYMSQLADTLVKLGLNDGSPLTKSNETFVEGYKIYNETVYKLVKDLKGDPVAIQFFLIEIYGGTIKIPKKPEGIKIALGSVSEFITFHQSFSYEDLIEGLRAETDSKGNIRYDVKNGVFKEFCINAFNDLITHARFDISWDEKDNCPMLNDEVKEKIRSVINDDDCPRYYLIIDEINRGNISKIFGELITLLEKDKRLGMENEMTITLPYSGKRFGVPPNLYVIGTMNSTDRSIALIDAALRRRFAFMELEPEKELVPEKIDEIPLRDIFVRMNEKIEVLKDRDHRIGHSYLMDKDDRPLKTVKDLQMRWFAEIIPLLQEYFYNEWEKLKEILGDGFIEDRDGPEISETDIIYDEERKVWRIKWELMKEDNVEKFKEAMLSIVKGGDDGDKSSSEEEGGEDKEH